MTSQPATQDLLTMQQAADAIGIDKGTLSRWVTLGRANSAYKAPGLRGVMLFDPAEVQRVKAENDAANQERTCAKCGETIRLKVVGERDGEPVRKWRARPSDGASNPIVCFHDLGYHEPEDLAS